MVLVPAIYEMQNSIVYEAKEIARYSFGAIDTDVKDNNLKMGEALEDNDKVVIAKMDMTVNKLDVQVRFFISC